MKKKWIYVICEYVDGMPSFRHAFIEAEDEECAYLIGADALPRPKNGQGINDYVIELPS